MANPVLKTVFLSAAAFALGLASGADAVYTASTRATEIHRRVFDCQRAEIERYRNLFIVKKRANRRDALRHYLWIEQYERADVLREGVNDWLRLRAGR